TALGHVRAPAATLTAKLRDRATHQIHGIPFAGEVLGHAHRHAGTAVLDRDESNDARPDPLLARVDETAESLGIHVVEDLADEAVSAHGLGARGIGSPFAAKRNRLLRF